MADVRDEQVEVNEGIERQGLIVWVNDSKNAKQLERFGIVHYVSRKMNYAVLYLNSERHEETIRSIQKLGFVKKVELSHRNDIWKRFRNYGTATNLTDLGATYQAPSSNPV